MAFDRKDGRGNKDFEEGRGQTVSRDGCLKKGVAGTPYELWLGWVYADSRRPTIRKSCKKFKKSQN